MNLYSTLSKLYPKNSWQGQCFTFLHKLVDFPPVGNSLGNKFRSLLTFGIPIAKLDTIKVGDIILTNESFYFGHGAFVNAIIGGKLQLTESNYSLNGKVNHTRLLSPNSKAIWGVFRANTGAVGNFKFALPIPQFPVQLTVKLFLNHPVWPSLLQHMANLQNWFWQASGQRIQLVIDYKQVNLSGWETVFTGAAIGGQNVEIIKEDWYDQNILPLGDGADIVIFNMLRSDWHGTVFDHPEQIELGYCYEKVNMSKPIKIFTVSDEFDDYPPYYPILGAYAKVAAHEIIHGLYGLACDYNKVTGDYTHLHFFGRTPDFPMKPEDCFSDFDYAKMI